MEFKEIIMVVLKSCLFFLLLVLIPCQSSLARSKKPVSPENRIAIVDVNQNSGSWDSSDVILTYQYDTLSGSIRLNVRGKAKQKYDELKVWVLFVDAEGMVLDKKLVYGSGYRTGQRSRGFSAEKTYTLPPKTTSMAFRSLLTPYLGP